MQISPPIVVLAASVAFAFAPIMSCSGPEVAYNPGGTLPPIRTTTTISPTESTSSPYFLHYTIRRGENVGMVARAFNIPTELLIEFNKDSLGENPSNVPVGTEIVIPPQRYIEEMQASSTTTTSTTSTTTAP